ncbi:MAG TPA: hypothetical protein VGJ20_27705 [Xanthobacteraceae bacterium]
MVRATTPNQTATFDIAVPHIAAQRRITTTWFAVVANFRQLELFQTIKVAPVINANGSNVIRLTFHPNEEPAHVVIQIFADGEGSDKKRNCSGSDRFGDGNDDVEL